MTSMGSCTSYQRTGRWMESYTREEGCRDISYISPGSFKKKRRKKNRMAKKRKKASRSRSKKYWIQKAVPQSHEGRFTAWAKRHGYKGVTAGAIRAGMNSPNLHVKRMANFANNMRKL